MDNHSLCPGSHTCKTKEAVDSTSLNTEDTVVASAEVSEAASAADLVAVSEVALEVA